ncbi:hypothetical protein B0H19DRAFT_193666 [Mycena capillaripes]|nr:hypothetical protein B0H19DRAFT_193666 [Mycena capillaripes]
MCAVFSTDSSFFSLLFLLAFSCMNLTQRGRTVFYLRIQADATSPNASNSYPPFASASSAILVCELLLSTNQQWLGLGVAPPSQKHDHLTRWTLDQLCILRTGRSPSRKRTRGNFRPGAHIFSSHPSFLYVLSACTLPRHAGVSSTVISNWYSFGFRTTRCRLCLSIAVFPALLPLIRLLVLHLLPM